MHSNDVLPRPAFKDAIGYVIAQENRWTNPKHTPAIIKYASAEIDGVKTWKIETTHAKWSIWHEPCANSSGFRLYGEC